MKLTKLIWERSGVKCDYGCVMLYFNFPEIFKFQDAIDPNDLASAGFEDEPHCTLLYGLHDSKINDQEIQDVLDQYTFTTCKVHNFSLFENDKHDVLKLDVVGDNLSNCNKDLKEFPNSNEYPNYNPHITVAYLKPGTGKKYCDSFNEKVKEFWLMPQYAVYSKSNGIKKKINIRKD